MPIFKDSEEVRAAPAKAVVAEKVVGDGEDPKTVAVELANRVHTIRSAWNDHVAGAPRSLFDVGVLRWVRDMYLYYHLGGTGCVLEAGGAEKCHTVTQRLPLCWSCAGGQGLPPSPDTIDLKENKDFAPVVDELVKNARLTTMTITQVYAHGERREQTNEELKESLFGTSAQSQEIATEKRRIEDAIFDEKVKQAADIVEGVDESKTLVVRISGIGACRRQVAYDKLGYDVTNPPKPEWQRSAKMGDAMESIIVEALTLDGEVVKNVLDEQQTVEWAWPKGGLLFRGHPDGDIKEDDHWLNLELKALKSERAGAIAASSIKMVTPHYYDQAHGYMRAKGQEQTYFAVMNRDSGEIITELVDFDKAHWKTLVDRWLEVKDIILAGKLPERDSTKGSFDCNVCRFRDLCWKAG